MIKVASKFRTQIFKMTLLVSVGFYLGGCATVSKPSETHEGVSGSEPRTGQWQAKAMMMDQKGKTHQVNLDIVARAPDAMRLEATGPIGAYLASFVLSQGEARFLDAQKKRFISGPASRSSLAQLLKVPVTSEELVALLFDDRFVQKNWTCTAASNGVIEQCRNVAAGLQVIWEERKEDSRRLKLVSKNGSMQLFLQTVAAKVMIDNRTFVLEAPRGFEKSTWE